MHQVASFTCLNVCSKTCWRLQNHRIDIFCVTESWHNADSTCLGRLQSAGFNVLDWPHPRVADDLSVNMASSSFPWQRTLPWNRSQLTNWQHPTWPALVLSRDSYDHHRRHLSTKICASSAIVFWRTGGCSRAASHLLGTRLHCRWFYHSPRASWWSTLRPAVLTGQLLCCITRSPCTNSAEYSTLWSRWCWRYGHSVRSTLTIYQDDDHSVLPTVHQPSHGTASQTDNSR